MRAVWRTVSIVLSGGSLLAALALVAWRQSRTRDLLAEVAQLRSERAQAETEMTEQSGRVQYLESRARVVPQARRRLGMRVPSSAEIVIFSPVDP